MQPSSSNHYNKHLSSTNNAENNSDSVNRLLNLSKKTTAWKQFNAHSSQNNFSSQNQNSYSGQQSQSQYSQSLNQQSKQQGWKRSYQKHPSYPSQMPDRSTSPPSPKFVAFTDADGSSPPSQRYKSSSSFQPPSLPIVSKLRYSGNSNNYNSSNINDLEDGELT